MDIIKQIGTANTTYAPGRTIKYIVEHYTAGVSSKKGSARSSASWFGNPVAEASADFIVDDVDIVQYNGDIENRYCWAVGGARYNTKGGSLYGIAKNANCISIEICSTNSTGKITYPNDPHYSLSDAAVNNAIQLTKHLMKQYHIDADHVIRHYEVNGKQCPGVIGWNTESGDESKWQMFKAKIGGKFKEPKFYRVRISWEDTSSQLGAYQDLNNAKENCPYGYAVYDEKGNEVYRPSAPDIKTLTAKDLNGMSEIDKIATVAPIYQKVMKKTGMLASVGLAQFCLESGFATTDLAQNANNMHGMKCSLSGNTWANSVWDGVSKYGKKSPEVYNGVTQMVYSEFRKYPSIYKSVQDRAAYFMGAWLDAAQTKHRYPNINMIKDAETQVKLLKSGGYATDPNYVSKLMNIISRFNLTQYDKGITPSVWNTSSDTSSTSQKPSSAASTQDTNTTSKVAKKTLYRVQTGAYESHDKAAKQIDKILKKTKLESFMEQDTNGDYHVYCGSFSQLAKAEERVALLQSKKIDAIIKEG